MEASQRWPRPKSEGERVSDPDVGDFRSGGGSPLVRTRGTGAVVLAETGLAAGRGAWRAGSRFAARRGWRRQGARRKRPRGPVVCREKRDSPGGVRRRRWTENCGPAAPGVRGGRWVRDEIWRPGGVEPRQGHANNRAGRRTEAVVSAGRRGGGQGQEERIARGRCLTMFRLRFPVARAAGQA